MGSQTFLSIRWEKICSWDRNITVTDSPVYVCPVVRPAGCGTCSRGSRSRLSRRFRKFCFHKGSRWTCVSVLRIPLFARFGSEARPVTVLYRRSVVLLQGRSIFRARSEEKSESCVCGTIALHLEVGRRSCELGGSATTIV